MPEHPLITFCVVAFKQERFIRKAIEGAFSQTYSPLEIILSDDCSPDGTFKAMEEMVADYRGPHRIILNHNKVNLGLNAHINSVAELSQGRLIVIAAGDDISLPNRVDWLVRAWQKNPETIMVVQSGFVLVDEFDTELGVVRKAPPGREIIRVAGRERLSDYLKTLRLACSGATFAYSRRMFDVFGPLVAGGFHEDNVFLLRALLLGEMWMVGVPLLYRRVHGGNMFIQKTNVRRSKNELDTAERQTRDAVERRIALYDAFSSDLATAGDQGLLSKLQVEEALELCHAQREQFSLERDYYAAGILTKLRHLQQFRRRGVASSPLRHFVSRLLPWPLLRAAKQMAAPFRKPKADSVLRGLEDYGLWNNDNTVNETTTSYIRDHVSA